jgi:hypothetical protein
LFEEYADAYARGERPRAHAYLERAAPEDRDTLAAMIERFLGVAPTFPAAEADRQLVGAWTSSETPLLVLRRARRLRRSQVVDALLRLLGLAEEARAKVADRYHERETGQLDGTRVNRRVFQALAETLQLRGEEVAALIRREPPSAPAAPAFRPQTAYFRAARDFDWDAESTGSIQADERLDDVDEVDRLFGVGPGTS